MLRRGMDLELAGKVAVVTGASKGIGLAVTQALAGEGARVVAGARTTHDLDGLERVSAMPLDLAAPDAPARLIGRALEEHGRVDVLVNNVGALRLRLEGFLALGDDDFEWAMQMNFFIALRATRAALAPMVEQGSGSIVNVASVNGFYHPDGAVIDYGAAKAALLNITKALSQEFGPQGVRINSVSPGPVDTDLWLGEHGVAETVAEATVGRRRGGSRGDRRRHGRHPDGPLHDARRGRHARRDARVSANRQRHRRQLRHRRRADQDDVRVRSAGAARARAFHAAVKK
jgi:NAD(P)-dependent dehydrogenase (short-subunit alcohol dehydrogenase family)